MDRETLAKAIDHTLLKTEATPADIRVLCDEAMRFGFAAVCVNPTYVALAAELIQGSDVAVCTVAGFPLGAGTTTSKLFDAKQSISLGATEIDMAMAVGRLKGGESDFVRSEIARLADLCHRNEVILKVILETALLTDAEKRLACELCCESGADFVKTSTGFASGGATVEDVRLMKEAVAAAGLKVKASGGIRMREDALRMIDAGADRIGTSSGVKIVAG
jgi:deoxyribose-phosphate aldolase